MLELHVRSKIQPLFNYIGYALAAYTTPNTITASACLFGLTAAGAVALHYHFTALCFLWLSGLCDVLDGTIARLTQQSNNLGAYLDLITDRIVESALILGFAYAYPAHNFAYLLFMAALLFHFSTFIAAGALFKNNGKKSMHHEYSLVERAEAFIIFSLMLMQPEYIYGILMGFNLVIIFDGSMRFYRIVFYWNHLELISKLAE